ncbi:MAG: tail fiber domain-containing protein [Bacteroidetes bacterium]|nr:tail fiber domain-containing protein [Bacteroidota bacterium]
MLVTLIQEQIRDTDGVPQVAFNYNNGDSYFRGHVGVGIASPGAIFHVSGAETSFHGKNAAIEISNTAALGTNWYLRSGATGTATPPKGFSIANDNGYWFVIDSTGKTGLGTTASTHMLEIQGLSNQTLPVTYSKVNWIGNNDVISMQGISQPAAGYGVGIEGIGGYIGVRGWAITPAATGNTYGGYFIASGAGSGTRYGCFATASGSTSTSVLNGNIYNNNWALYASGNACATGLWLTSDARFKKEVQPLKNSIDKIMELKPSSYFFKTDEYGFMNLPTERQDGFLAQDLEKFFLRW